MYWHDDATSEQRGKTHTEQHLFFINKQIFGRILFMNWDSFPDPSLQDSGFIINGFPSEFIESLHCIIRQLNQKYHVYIQRFFVRECFF